MRSIIILAFLCTFVIVTLTPVFAYAPNTPQAKIIEDRTKKEASEAAEREKLRLQQQTQTLNPVKKSQEGTILQKLWSWIVNLFL